MSGTENFVPTCVREPATLVDILRDEIMYRAAQYDPLNQGLKWEDLSAYTQSQYRLFADDYIRDGVARIFGEEINCIVFAAPEEDLTPGSDYLNRIQVIAPDAEMIEKFYAVIKRERAKWAGVISDGYPQTPEQAQYHEQAVLLSMDDSWEFTSALISKAAEASEHRLIETKKKLAKIFLDEDLGMREELIDRVSEYACSVLDQDDSDELDAIYAARRAASQGVEA